MDYYATKKEAKHLRLIFLQEKAHDLAAESNTTPPIFTIN